ncbi:hypothetical protein WJX84_006422 [Apatococcus fuscideae]|uniref:Uncharacterized protein n=1 Tax=Apatococcus fuscideae TaxID=2026836 RepID=A0AAW1T2G3_9CHLO
MGPETLAKVARKRRRRFPSGSEALAKYARRPPFNSFAPASLEAYGAYGFKDVTGGVELRCDPADEAETYVTLHGSMPQYWPEVKRVSCPIAILAGSRNPNSEREIIAGILEETAAQLSTAVFARLQGLYHMGPLEDPGRVAILAHHKCFVGRAAKEAAISRL